MRRWTFMILWAAAGTAAAADCELTLSERRSETAEHTLFRTAGGALVARFGVRDGSAYVRGRYETQTRRVAVFSAELPITLRLADGAIIELAPNAAAGAGDEPAADSLFPIDAAALALMSAMPITELTLHMDHNGVLELEHRSVRSRQAKAIRAAIACLPIGSLAE